VDWRAATSLRSRAAYADFDEQARQITDAAELIGQRDLAEPLENRRGIY
jgi:hypothetical protein